MNEISTGMLLIILAGIVVLSYLFSLVSKYIRIPSVLLLMFAGMGARLFTESKGLSITFPEKIVELLGTVGLIIIVLEAGLDLKLKRSRIKLIRNSFAAAFVILLVTAAGISLILHYWLGEDIKKCIIYAIPFRL